jgi:hypothetical protein
VYLLETFVEPTVKPDLQFDASFSSLHTVDLVEFERQWLSQKCVCPEAASHDKAGAVLVAIRILIL